MSFNICSLWLWYVHVPYIALSCFHCCWFFFILYNIVITYDIRNSLVCLFYTKSMHNIYCIIDELVAYADLAFSGSRGGGGGPRDNCVCQGVRGLFSVNLLSAFIISGLFFRGGGADPPPSPPLDPRMSWMSRILCFFWCFFLINFV